MKDDLKRKLLTDDHFAHDWLCHYDGSKCPDGCDQKADPKRLKEYQQLELPYFTN